MEPPPLEVWTEVGINLGRNEPESCNHQNFGDARQVKKLERDNRKRRSAKPLAFESNSPSPISINAVLVFSDSLDSATSFRRHRSNAG